MSKGEVQVNELIGQLPINLQSDSGKAVLPGLLPTHVVGIGASAGGLESLESLFRNLPQDTGMAFVVLQHLSPDFKSMMFELLGRDTQMRINRAEDGMVLQANEIYLLPPKKEMIISGGRLYLTDKDPARGIALPIDRFLESLARELGPKAIAVILSGSGSDGSRGVRQVARYGGLVIVETPATAKFDGMPLSAQATGAVDLFLPPSEIGPALAQASNQLISSPEDGVEFQASVGPLGLSGIEAILELLRCEYEIDFGVYKEATIFRRIHRRMALVGIGTIEAYANTLAMDKTELSTLHEDLLIGVTQFFRDEEAFHYLSESVIQELIQRHPHNKAMRIWVSACGTGEEAYSLAILFNEAMQRANVSIKLKIFATDVHRKSLVKAGRGLFRDGQMRGISDSRREQFFERKGEFWQIAPAIREAIVFAPHNLLRDAPFTDLDFVACRNLLIYFQPEAQAKALSMFHFGLVPGGVLFLGGSESLGELTNDFTIVSEHHKIYRKSSQVRLHTEIRLPNARRPEKNSAVAAIRGFSEPMRQAHPNLLSTYDQLLDKFMPPSLLVNEQRQLIDSYGGAEKLLHFQARRPSLSLLEIVDPSLKGTLAGAIQRAEKSGSQVRFTGLKIQRPEGLEEYNLVVDPIHNSITRSICYLLAFESVNPTTVARPDFETLPSSSEVSTTAILQLENDLKYARENLQATIEELETSNEELQATNEELVASNEELQSTNEELHSVNEELYTVNAEHQRKISELAEVNQDLYHLLENTDVATLFLDSELCVRKFTSRIRKIFDLLDQDIGRPISSFAHRIQLENFVKQLIEVRDGGKPFESEVHSAEGDCYLLRILPYRMAGRIGGVVVALVDLASLEDLRGRLRWMSAIVESTDDAIIGENLQGYITSWNKGAEKLYGYRSEEAIGRHVSFMVPKNRRSEIDDYLTLVQQGQSIRTFETIRTHRDGRPIHISLTVSAVRDSSNRVIGVSKIARDVSIRFEIESQLRSQAKMREKFLAMLSHELRNPLSAVLAASRLFSDSRANQDDRDKAAVTVERQAKMIGSLLNDLLDVSRISQGKIELKRQKLDFRSLIPTVRETTQPEISSHRSVLIFHTPEHPVWIAGDPARLIQVQVNLIHNAAKYSSEGSTIEVVIRCDAHWAILEVKDQGVGIAKEFLPQVFELFTQSDETLDRSEGGLGVGLTLVKTLVELHGGSVEAYSPGRNLGSTFTVRLPLTAAPEESPLTPVEASAPTPFAGSSQDGAEHVLTEQQLMKMPFQVRRVVLVEDLEESREMLKSILELEGYQVLSAGNGESGCDLILRSLPDVALVDIGLPGISGYEVARRVRQTLDDRVYLVALTGYGQKADTEEALKSGFHSHLVKPASIDDLLQLLANLPSRETIDEHTSD